MGGEGAQALLDALLIPDIREYIVKNCQLRALESRNVEAGLSHEGKKPHGFQGNRLASGIGSGHDQQIKILPQPYVDGHDLLRIQQRVPPVLDSDMAFRIEDGAGGLHISGEHGPGEDKIQSHHQAVIVGQQFQVSGGGLAEGGQHLFYFLLFFDLQLPVFVIQLDYSHGLHKERGTGGALVVDHTGHLVAVLGFYGKTVPPVPHGDHRVL